MSQFCGSFAALINRCGVTSAAIAGMVSAARPIDERAARIVLSGISFLPACCDRREFLCAVALKSRGSDCAVLASPARTPLAHAIAVCRANPLGDAAGLWLRILLDACLVPAVASRLNGCVGNHNLTSIKQRIH